MALRMQKVEVDEIEIRYEELSGRKWVRINGQEMRATTGVEVHFTDGPFSEVKITFMTDNVTVTRLSPGDGVNA